MINLPKDWVKGVRLDEDDFRIFTIGRFKLYQPINEQILILLDTKLNQTWGCEKKFNSRTEYENEIKSLRRKINQYYREQRGKQLKIQFGAIN